MIIKKNDIVFVSYWKTNSNEGRMQIFVIPNVNSWGQKSGDIRKSEVFNVPVISMNTPNPTLDQIDVGTYGFSSIMKTDENGKKFISISGIHEDNGKYQIRKTQFKNLSSSGTPVWQFTDNGYEAFSFGRCVNEEKYIINCAMVEGDDPELPVYIYSCDIEDPDYPNKQWGNIHAIGKKQFVGDYDGKPNTVIEKYNQGKVRYTESIPAWWKPEYADMESGNHMISQTCQATVYDGIQDNGHAVSSQVTTWSSHTVGSNNLWHADSIYVWNQEMGNDGLLPNGITLPVFPFNNLSNLGNHWKFMGGVKKYNRFNSPILTVAPIGNQRRTATTIIYGHFDRLPVATIKNCSLDSCGVFTCDYNNFELNNGVLYLDQTSGWERGMLYSNTPAESFELAPGTGHFGETSMHIINCQGPTKNIKYNPNLDYSFSAWIKVPSGKLPPKFKVELHRDNNGSIGDEIGSYDLDNIQNLSEFQYGKWVFIEHVIRSSKLQSHITSTNVKANEIKWVRIWTGNESNENPSEYYIDDIRFYPNKAGIVTTYYDKKWQMPIISIGPDNKTSQKTKYDEFGRPIKLEKYDYQTGSWVTSKETHYHLMKSLSNGEHIRILYPNGGETFSGQENIYINWINDVQRAVKIFYKVGAGAWIQLAALSGYENTGSWYWSNKPSEGTKDIRIKIEDAYESSISDESDNSFKINTPPPTAINLSASQNNSNFTVTFDWYCVDDADGDALSYNLYIDGIGCVAQNITVKTFTKTFLPEDAGRTIRWYVESNDGFTKRSCQSVTFTIGALHKLTITFQQVIDVNNCTGGGFCTNTMKSLTSEISSIQGTTINIGHGLASLSPNWDNNDISGSSLLYQINEQGISELYYLFDGWTGSGATLLNNGSETFNNSLIMPGNDISLTATYIGPIDPP